MWEPPLSFGGASQIDSYTVTLMYTSDDGVDHSIRDTVEEEQIFPISDALLYMANVTALNCIGESTAATQTIHTGEYVRKSCSYSWSIFRLNVYMQDVSSLPDHPEVTWCRERRLALQRDHILILLALITFSLKK